MVTGGYIGTVTSQRSHSRRALGTMATLAEKVAALRRLFGLAESSELLPTIAKMNEAMGVVGEGALPNT